MTFDSAEALGLFVFEPNDLFFQSALLSFLKEGISVVGSLHDLSRIYVICLFIFAPHFFLSHHHSLEFCHMSHPPRCIQVLEGKILARHTLLPELSLAFLNREGGLALERRMYLSY